MNKFWERKAEIREETAAGVVKFESILARIQSGQLGYIRLVDAVEKTGLNKLTINNMAIKAGMSIQTHGRYGYTIMRSASWTRDQQ